MALQLRQSLKLSQQLVMTPQLQQAIKMLQLSRLELIDTIREELEQNPILETATEEELARSETSPEAEAEDKPQVLEVENDFKEVKVEETAREDIDWETYLGEYSSSSMPASMREIPDETNYDNFISAKTSLTDHLAWQWRMNVLTPLEERIGAQIIGNLDADGYLKATVEEIAELESVTPAEVEQVLARVQDLDPAGVAARDLRECLLLQLHRLEADVSSAEKIVSDLLPELEKKNYPQIARALKTTKEAVFAAVELILTLEPRPGRSFSTEEPQYITPDVYIYKVGDDFIITLNEDGMPRLRVNNYYQKVLSNHQVGSNQAKEYIQGKLRAAVWLIRSIHQRQRTIYRVTESIVKFQREFLDKGVAYLKPLVLRDVADDVGMHESTISRVTSNKYVHTPQGIFELKFFFNSSINRFDGESMASESVKERIRLIVAAEDPRRPLSDQRIVEILRGSNIDIARRTVAKYREMLGILSSSKRKKYF
jgi:RNA polymerase sigma-54 factor